MKNKLLIWASFFLAVLWLTPSCETDMEKSQKDYSADQVVPIVISTSGTALALQTFSYDFKVTYFRAGSTWAWTAEGATVQTVSEDTRTATVKFTTIPANDTALIKVIETTSAGVASPEKVIKVKVDPFCPLAPTGFVGTWGGTDGYGTSMYPSAVVTSAPTATTVGMKGLNAGWIFDYWGEVVTDEGLVAVTIVQNGTLTIADQYIFTTVYGGDPYEYWVKGSGTWSNCGAKPTMIIDYNVYYKSDGYQLPSNSNKTLKFKATLTLN